MKELTYNDWLKNPTPRMMWVWDNLESAKVQRKVIYFLGSTLTLPIVAITSDEVSTEHFMHCAEIEKSRIMTNQYLSRWLRENPTREWKYKGDSHINVVYTYSINNKDEEVSDSIVIRENDGEWREPFVEV